jgi:hypothetical protein
MVVHLELISKMGGNKFEKFFIETFIEDAHDGNKKYFSRQAPTIRTRNR